MSDDKLGQCAHGYYGLCPHCYESLRAELAELRARSTHCDNCGCDWLDNGLNPVGCPYCKHDDNKFNPCLNSLVRQVWLMMDDCEEHADGRITIDSDISQGFLRRIYDLLNALEDCGYDPEDAILAADTEGRKDE